MCAGKRQHSSNIVTIFSHMTRDVSVFVRCDTIFRCFLGKLPQIRIISVRKVVRQHAEGISIICVLLQI